VLFSVDLKSLERTVGEENVHRLQPQVAEAYGFNGEALRFLTQIGLPDDEEFEITFRMPVTFDAAFIWDRASREARGWHFPAGVESVVKIGAFPINAVVIDPNTGVVYQFTDAIKELIPVHGDLSSLARTVSSFLEYIGTYSRHEDEDDEDVEYVRRKREVDDMMSGIRLVDSLPFANEYSEWVELFDNLEGGIYT
jgi:hypothetical protein